MSALTFGTFLPTRFQLIEKEAGDYVSDSGSHSSVQLEPYGGGASTSQPVVQKLQFFDVRMSTHSTPVEIKIPKDNRIGTMGKTLSYIPPNIKDGRKCVEIVRDNLKEQEEYWKTDLIGFVIGDTPYLKTMEKFIQTIWKTINTPQIMLHNEGYFVFRFEFVVDYESILQAGPYYFHNKPFIHHQWEVNFEFNPECICTIPLWVTFPELPVG
ncbi:hypothetical protein KY284_026526 [Solanum tuberosum]|nr:hypothetical protein KY284_026526 [Solanum tuberosum]